MWHGPLPVGAGTETEAYEKFHYNSMEEASAADALQRKGSGVEGSKEQRETDDALDRKYVRCCDFLFPNPKAKEYPRQ